jgi:hypothetical protein
MTVDGRWQWGWAGFGDPAGSYDGMRSSGRDVLVERAIGYEDMLHGRRQWALEPKLYQLIRKNDPRQDALPSQNI